jgi:hypothetical protein
LPNVSDQIRYALINANQTGAAGDGKSDAVDVFTCGMKTGPDSLITISPPEPSGLALAGLGMLGISLAVARRRPWRISGLPPWRFSP